MRLSKHSCAFVSLTALLIASSCATPTQYDLDARKAHKEYDEDKYDAALADQNAAFSIYIKHAGYSPSFEYRRAFSLWYVGKAKEAVTDMVASRDWYLNWCNNVKEAVGSVMEACAVAADANELAEVWASQIGITVPPQPGTETGPRKALAVAMSPEGAWGVGVGASINQAKSNAIAACAQYGGCVTSPSGVVGPNFYGCVAIARGGTHTAWAVSNTLQNAQAAALDECAKSGGVACVVTRMDCNYEGPLPAGAPTMAVQAVVPGKKKKKAVKSLFGSPVQNQGQ